MRLYSFPLSLPVIHTPAGHQVHDYDLWCPCGSFVNLSCWLVDISLIWQVFISLSADSPPKSVLSHGCLLLPCSTGLLTGMFGFKKLQGQKERTLKVELQVWPDGSERALCREQPSHHHRLHVAFPSGPAPTPTPRLPRASLTQTSCHVEPHCDSHKWLFSDTQKIPNLPLS